MTIIQDLVQADNSVLLAINGNHNEVLDMVMNMASDKLIWIPLYVVLLWVVYRQLGLLNTILWALTLAVCIFLADQIASGIIKPLVGRLRPSNELNPLSVSLHYVDGYHGGTYGFPSSHASNTTAFVLYFWITLRRRYITSGLLVWMALIWYSRMYLGVHYPSDILGGIAVGLVCGGFMSWVYVRLHRKMMPDEVELGDIDKIE